jgi:hypothetical protein
MQAKGIEYEDEFEFEYEYEVRLKDEREKPITRLRRSAR